MKSGHIGLLVLQLAGNINWLQTLRSNIQSKRSRLFEVAQTFGPIWTRNTGPIWGLLDSMESWWTQDHFSFSQLLMFVRWNLEILAFKSFNYLSYINWLQRLRSNIQIKRSKLWRKYHRRFDLFRPEILVRSGAYWTLWKAGGPRIIFALINF